MMNLPWRRLTWAPGDSTCDPVGQDTVTVATSVSGSVLTDAFAIVIPGIGFAQMAAADTSQVWPTPSQSSATVTCIPVCVAIALWTNRCPLASSTCPNASPVPPISALRAGHGTVTDLIGAESKPPSCPTLSNPGCVVIDKGKDRT